MNRPTVCVVVSVLLLVACAIGRADISIHGPVFPSPAGPTAGGGSGVAGVETGFTYSYNTFEMDNVRNLWFGLNPDYLPSLDFGQGGAATQMTFSSSTSNQMIWTGNADFRYSVDSSVNPHETVAVDTRFKLTLSGAGQSGFGSLGALIADDPTFDTSIERVARITGDYQANFQFEARDPLNPDPDTWWIPAVDLFNTYDTEGTTNLSVGAGFYWQRIIQGPDFPTPAGPTDGGGSGDMSYLGKDPGWTYSYEGIDTSQVKALWFGLNPNALPNLELGHEEDDMTFYSAADNKMVWMGEATFEYSIDNDDEYDTAVVDTRFTMTLAGGAGSFFDADDLLAIDPLFDSSIEAATRINGDYEATFLFEARDPMDPDPDNWIPANTLFNNYYTPVGATTQMDVGGAFYWTPEPSSMAFMGSAFIGVVAYVVIRRRRKNR
ncbi:MAG: PEP-CTERM sorting domain-containing protein [Pirellulales bacterium]|nr:PEP-CTERM sorting domain-containing protein [Pirellulales bacterium]